MDHLQPPRKCSTNFETNLRRHTDLYAPGHIMWVCTCGYGSKGAEEVKVPTNNFKNRFYPVITEFNFKIGVVFLPKFQPAEPFRAFSACEHGLRWAFLLSRRFHVRWSTTKSSGKFMRYLCMVKYLFRIPFQNWAYPSGVSWGHLGPRGPPGQKSLWPPWTLWEPYLEIDSHQAFSNLKQNWRGSTGCPFSLYHLCFKIDSCSMGVTLIQEVPMTSHGNFHTYTESYNFKPKLVPIRSW